MSAIFQINIFQNNIFQVGGGAPPQGVRKARGGSGRRRERVPVFDPITAARRNQRAAEMDRADLQAVAEWQHDLETAFLLMVA